MCQKSDGYFQLFLWSYHIRIIVLRHGDNLSRTLQKPSTTASYGKKAANLTLIRSNSLRSDVNFDLIWDKVLNDVNTLQSAQASLPRKVSELDQSIFSLETRLQLMMMHVM